MASNRNYRGVILGSGGIGKSALLLQFWYGEFVDSYEPTKAESYTKKYVLDGCEVLIDIMDTAGQESYHNIRESYCRNADGFLLVASIDEPESVNVMKENYELVARVKGNQPTPMVVVVTKIDLLNTPDEEQIRVFNSVLKECREFADTHNIAYAETSSKTQKNVINTFEILLRLIRDSRVDETKPATKKKKTRYHCVLL